ncbi:hypothetical protein DJ82_07830 [Halorubrum sp. Ib24]|uniref:hypothetical protein n=1 Tax=Halorubrum sp. Ib24 TaxID=1383850 RepID=UPI000B98366F|nr:hypothetical protein [Halorubrum sp. Ib24]OYR40359.1 hypothetical protein DJ82_07830 [Halorubrum sp. Ib24]
MRPRRRAESGAPAPRPAAGGVVGVVGALGASVAVLAATAGLVAAVAPAVGADPLRAGAVALPNWTPIAAAVVAFAIAWLTAIGAAHAIATAFARR